MANGSERLYPNPPNMSFIVLGALGSLIVAVAALLYLYWAERTALAVLMALGGLMIFLYVCSIEYLSRPIGLGITDINIIIRRRFRKDAIIPLDQVVMIYFHKGDDDTFFGRFNNNGGIYLSGRTYAPIKVTPEFAKLVQERFAMKMGHYPEAYPGSDG